MTSRRVLVALLAITIPLLIAGVALAVALAVRIIQLEPPLADAAMTAQGAVWVVDHAEDARVVIVGAAYMAGLR